MKLQAWISSFFLFGALVSPALAQTPQDILFQTRVEKGTLNWLIEKTRLIMGNAQVTDMLKGEAIVDTMPTFALEEMSSDPETLRLRDTFASVFKTDLKNAVIRLRIPKVFYQIDKLLVTPKGLNVTDPTLTLNVEGAIQGLKAQLTEGLQADIMIPDANNKLQSFLTVTLDPVSLQIPTTLEPLVFGVEFETIRDQGFKFKLKSYDISAVPIYVERYKSQLVVVDTGTQKPISVEQIKINPVIVRLSKLTRSVNFDSFKPIIQKKMNKIVSMVFSLLGNSLKNTLGPHILSNIFSNNTRSDMMLTSEFIHTRYSTSMFSQPQKDQLVIGIQGDLCTSKLFKEFQEQCTEHVIPYEPVREITPEEKQKGLDELTEQLAQNKMDLAISITEDYINRLLKTTIDADLWDERLSDDKLSLGPRGVFTVFNKQTQTPEMFIDLYYEGDHGAEKLLINERHPIRFPLRLSTSVGFPLKDGVPHLVIRTEKLLSDRDEIINGIPEYDLNSHLVKFFKKKIAKMIIKMASKLEGQVAVDLDFPILKGVGLEKTTYETSAYGRLNWYFKL